MTNASVETARDGHGQSAPTPGGRLRQWVAGRRGLILFALLIIGAGLVLKWEWLSAVGIAPLLIAFAPCAAMCALGLCMSRMGNKSCSTNAPSGTKSL